MNHEIHFIFEIDRKGFDMAYVLIRGNFFFTFILACIFCEK